MRKYTDCYTEAKNISARLTEEQVIQAANGIYMADTIGAQIKRMREDLFSDHQGYKGLRVLMNEATELCKRLGR